METHTDRVPVQYLTQWVDIFSICFVFIKLVWAQTFCRQTLGNSRRSIHFISWLGMIVFILYHYNTTVMFYSHSV